MTKLCFQCPASTVILSIWMLLVLQNYALSGDPCPAKNDLTPCTCSQIPLNGGSKLAYIGTELALREKLRSEEIESGDLQLKRSLNSDVAITTPLPILEPNSSFYTVVTCKVPKSVQVLEEAIANGLHRKWVDKLIVSNLPPKKEHTLVRLPKSWLKNLRVKQFEVRDTLLSGDFVHYGNPFEGQDQSLVWLTACNCYLSGGLTYDTIGTVNTKGLNLLPRLEGVDFSRNHLVYVHALGFRYPSANLTSVILSHNSIQGVEGTTFHYAPKLKYVDLSHNLLEGIARSIFASPASALQHIDLSWNHLTVLPQDFFINMPALRIVNLKNNFLYSLPDKPWLGVWKQLTFIDVAGNFLECNCDFLWLLSILSPPVVNVTTTPPPKPLLGQTVLGTCSQTQPQLFTKPHRLVELTRASLNCNA